MCACQKRFLQPRVSQNHHLRNHDKRDDHCEFGNLEEKAGEIAAHATELRLRKGIEQAEARKPDEQNEYRRNACGCHHHAADHEFDDENEAMALAVASPLARDDREAFCAAWTQLSSAEAASD